MQIRKRKGEAAGIADAEAPGTTTVVNIAMKISENVPPGSYHYQLEGLQDSGRSNIKLRRMHGENGGAPAKELQRMSCKISSNSGPTVNFTVIEKVVEEQDEEEQEKQEEVEEEEKEEAEVETEEEVAEEESEEEDDVEEEEEEQNKVVDLTEEPAQRPYYTRSMARKKGQ